MLQSEFSEFLKKYFLKYSKINTQSVTSNVILPSSEGQKLFIKLLQEDLRSFGISDITIYKEAILVAKIPKNTEAPSLSFMSHIDTVDIGENSDVNAQIIHFTGENITLNVEKNIILKVSEYPEISKYKNDQIIVTDGTSVLGADDKAGVTVMVGLAQYLMKNPEIKHGDIYFIFVPDEEVGLRGAYAFDTNILPKDVLSFTIDGGPLGEFGYETFNGAGVSIDIKGVSIHPGQAKGILVNPILVAHDIIAKLDRFDTPEHSEGKEGFMLVTDMSGNASDAHIHMIIRDFDKQKFENRKIFIQNIVKEIQQLHPQAKIFCDISDSYANIANNLGDDRRCVDIVEKAMNNLDIPLHIEPIRGGTDGAVFSSKGIPTPNIFTGAHNIHSIFEYLPVSSFTKSLETVVEIVRISPQYHK